ncbi:hypothetical protein [Allonocardiopsis opalescens]|uniref:Uncharacterized protein n=1 Tax=Allonocardiopsis opalescens TaxID=1144618 RepID=A0A2T0Q765_9ACTN|nr:hypothetical protein [Allonocardiopsis opalescens]PRX99676.1 hypothetical protein CLV72_103281 [Allonocardiopsis opalescens]
MLHSIPPHPYPRGARVHHARENDDAYLRDGTATVVTARPEDEGVYWYTVNTDDGEQEEWPSYFTIPAGLWSDPAEEEDPGAGPMTDEPVFTRRQPQPGHGGAGVAGHWPGRQVAWPT